MRFETTPAFERDYKRLKPEHKAAFRKSISAFSAGCDAFAEHGGGYRWPAVRHTITVVRWRRVGDHGFFTDP